MAAQFGETLAELLATGHPDIPLGPYSIDRPGARKSAESVRG